MESTKILVPINKLLIKYKENDISFQNASSIQPIFIVGAPRTGSTLLYQIITHSFDVSYISNFVSLFHHSLYLGFLLNGLIIGEQKHNSFTSIHGLTKGVNGPNECGQFWYNWLPIDRHFIEKGQISQKSINEIRLNIFSIIRAYKRPFVFKNMNAGLRLQLISEIAPNAKLIFIRRNPLFTAQSILMVRKRLYGDYSNWWSLLPRNYSELSNLDFCEQVVKQIYYIEKQICRDSALFSATNVFHIDYSEFANSPKKLLERLHTFIGTEVPYKHNLKLPKIRLSAGRNVSDWIFRKLKSEINKLDWNDYSS